MTGQGDDENIKAVSEQKYNSFFGGEGYMKVITFIYNIFKFHITI